MRIESLNNLSEKEVINLKDCRRIGYITDVNIDIECGNVVSFVVSSYNFCRFKCDEFIVNWDCVKKIGDDIIFVDVSCQRREFSKEKKKFIKN